MAKRKFREFTKEDMAQIEENMAKDRALRSVPYVIDQVIDKMRKHRLPERFAFERKTWLPTNLWRIDWAAIRDSNTFVLIVTMRWRTAEDDVSTNPLGEPGMVPGFGPGFKLPHELTICPELTRMPSRAGWSTGVAPCVPERFHSMVEGKIKEELLTLAWFGGTKEKSDYQDLGFDF